MSIQDSQSRLSNYFCRRSVPQSSAVLAALFVMTAAIADSIPAPKKPREQSTPPPTQSTQPVEVSEFQRAAHGSRKVAPTAFTNDDLERMFGPPTPESKGEPVADPVETATATPEAASDVATPEKSPLDAMADQERARLQKERDLAAASAKVDELRKRVEDVEQRGRAVRNPLLPRPSVPKDQQGDWNQLGASDRAARTDAELAAAREELSKAEADLARAGGSNP